MRSRIPDAPPVVGARPLVAVVGRPNVGKSTLFNRLADLTLAIVEDMPGVTRDRLYADADLHGIAVTLIDTGGLDPEPGDPVTDLTRGQVEAALAEADLVVCVFDGRVELTRTDYDIVKMLRRGGKRVIYVANKVDGPRQLAGALATYAAGVDEVLPISALHGRGMADLVDRMIEALPPREAAEPLDAPEGTVRVAIVGRPNAGKSSLVNRLLGEPRMLTHETPGTTRDAVDSLLEHQGRRFVLIDTAGLRRRSRIDTTAERLAMLSALRALERAHVAVSLIDAQADVAEQDAKICGLAESHGCALVLALNKWDLVKGGGEQRKIDERVRDLVSFAPYAPLVHVSARTGRGVDRLMSTVARVALEHDKRVGTADLNRFFEEVLERKPPPLSRGRAVRFYYVSQVAVRPPKFAVVCNFPDAVHFSYQRFVVNRLRERFGFEGTPIRVVYSAKRRRRRSARQ